MPLFYLLISGMPLTRDPLLERFMSDLTAIKYLGLACLAYAVWHCTLGRRGPGLWFTPQACWMELLCLWSAASWLLLGPPIAWDLSPLLSYVSFCALLGITLAVVDTWSRLEHVLWALMLSVTLASLYIVREWQEYHAVYANFRPGWVTGDPNYFTASALIGLPLALVFGGHVMPLAWRWMARGCALLILVAIGLAGSRGGLLGLGVMLLFLCWKKRRLGALVLAVALATVPLLLWSNSPLNRLLHPTISDQKSSNTRLALWQAGLHMIAAHPLTGIGLGNFKVEVQQYATGHKDLDHIAHNSYLEIAAEMGLPALAFYVLVAWYSDRSLAAAMAAASEHGQGPWLPEAALALRAGLIGFSVSAFFLSAEYTKLYWMLVALSAALARLAAQAEPTAEASVIALEEEPFVTHQTGAPAAWWPKVVGHG